MRRQDVACCWRKAVVAANRSLRSQLPPHLGAEGQKRIAGQRPREGIALQQVAAEQAQHFGMLHRLHAFRHDLDAERAANLDDRAHQRLLVTRGEDGRHELAVDLQALRLQLQKADDGGMAGAEIVDLDVDAEFLDPLEPSASRLSLIHI